MFGLVKFIYHITFKNKKRNIRIISQNNISLDLMSVAMCNVHVLNDREILK